MWIFGTRKHFKIICNLNIGTLLKLLKRFWQSWGRKGRHGKGRGRNHLFQSSRIVSKYSHHLSLIRLVREQKSRVSKVMFTFKVFLSKYHLVKNQSTFTYCVTFFKELLVGIHDEDSPLNKLRSPRYVVKDVMPIVWEHLTWDWKVGTHFHFHDFRLLIAFSKTKCYRCTTRTMVTKNAH